MMGKTGVTVFGSFVVDLTGWASHLPEAGETVFGEQFKMGPGGKGSNQAVAAHRAGADVAFITKVGEDTFAEVALDFYQREAMDTSNFLKDKEHPTGAALICVDEKTGQNQILVVPGACTHFTDEDVELIRPVIEQSAILLLQFEVNLDALEKVMDIARARGVKIILNPAPARDIPGGLLQKAHIITPNESEAGALLGMEIRGENDAQAACEAFHAMGIAEVVITMGKSGIYVSAHGRQAMIPAYKVKAVDTTGAGDAFNGAFAVALSEGKDLFEAAAFGNAAGALSVMKQGTAPAMPYREAIEQFVEKFKGEAND